MPKKSVIALGTFDGVHLGHQKILKEVFKFSKKEKIDSIATTFDPHPQQYLVPERGLKLLTTVLERKKLLKSFGIKKVSILKFNENLRNLKYEEFIKKYLVKKLNVGTVFVGYDYAFGYKRSGGIGDLRKIGKKYGFAVKVIKPVKIRGINVKSSLIRDMIVSGDFDSAVDYLGHFYALEGVVIHGSGRGRTLGFPTANVLVDNHKLLPHHGVYMARLNNKKRCLVNIGSRPTFGPGKVFIEVFIPRFKGNLYGKRVRVELIKKFRDEKQFSDVEDLKGQIKKDVAKCLSYVIQ